MQVEALNQVEQDEGGGSFLPQVPKSQPKLVGIGKLEVDQIEEKKAVDDIQQQGRQGETP